MLYYVSGKKSDGLCFHSHLNFFCINGQPYTKYTFGRTRKDGGKAKQKEKEDA